MSDFDFTNTEEALQNLRNQLKKNEQAYARKALSETLGIDFDKLAAFGAWRANLPTRNNTVRNVAQLGSAPTLGAGGRGFESRHSDDTSARHLYCG